MKHRTCTDGTQTKRFRRILLGGTAAVSLLLLALRPQQCAAACAEGIALWAKTVLPALFPFLVLTTLLTKTGAAANFGKRLHPLLRPLGLPAASAGALLLSVLSGYPVGSRIVADLHSDGALDDSETQKLSILCSTSGPMFILGSVGNGMFGDLRAGTILLSAHLLGIFSVFIGGFLLQKLRKRRLSSPEKSPRGPENGRPSRTQKKRTPTAFRPKTNAALAKGPQSAVLGESMQSAVLAVLCVGGFIAIACVLIRLSEDLSLLRLPTALLASCLQPLGSETCAQGMIYGLLEATRGCAALAATAGTEALPYAAFVITFGGASILAQQLAFLRPAGVPAGRFIAVKAVQGAAAFLFCSLFCAF